MSGLDSITYSRNATVAAVRDYYAFLASMYLDPADVQTPPATGWPSIDSLQCTDKTPEVLDLLCHLPYIRQDEDDGTQAFPGCRFADWRQLAETAGPHDGLSLRECSEPVELVDRIPAYVVGLAYGGRENSTFLLDTKRGIVHWYECGDSIKYGGGEEDPEWIQPVTDVDDPADWEDLEEDEADWRAEHPAWSIADFFAILKQQFRDLVFVPVGSRVVYSTREDEGAEDLGELLPAVQDIYRSHGWPNLEVFDKEACLREVRRVVREEHPDHAYLFDGDEEDEDEDDDE